MEESFSRFLNCSNGTKSRNAPQIISRKVFEVIRIIYKQYTAWKVSVFGVILVCIFPRWDNFYIRKRLLLFIGLEQAKGYFHK